MALTPKQMQAIVKLVETGSTDEAATAVGVHRTTVRRWWTDVDEFRAAYLKACEEKYRAVLGPMVSAMHKAVTKLNTLLDSPKTADVIRSAAVLSKLSHTMISHMLLEQRLMALEESVRHVDTGTRPLLTEAGVIDLDDDNFEVLDDEQIDI